MKPKISLFFLVFAISSSTALAQYAGWDFIGNVYSTGPFKVKNVPLNFRQVPVHPDHNPPDYTWPCKGTACNTRTVDDSNLDPVLAGVDLGIAAAFNIKRSYVRTGAQWTFPLYPLRARDPQDGVGRRGSMREQNGVGANNRGVGTSLTYYAAVARPDYIPGPVIEAAFPVSRHIFLKAGVSANFWQLKIEKGYDRYNKLEKLDTSPLARVLNIYPNCGMAYVKDGHEYFNLSVGPIMMRGFANSSAPGYKMRSGGVMAKLGFTARKPSKSVKN